MAEPSSPEASVSSTAESVALVPGQIESCLSQLEQAVNAHIGSDGSMNMKFRCCCRQLPLVLFTPKHSKEPTCADFEDYVSSWFVSSFGPRLPGGSSCSGRSGGRGRGRGRGGG